jgi:hypothetical protein
MSPGALLNGSAAWALLVTLYSAYAALIVWAIIAFRRAAQRQPHRIVKQLKTWGGEVRVRVPKRIGKAWNPTKSERWGNDLAGPGLAVYTLDQAGNIRLDFEPRNGQALHLSAPVPEALLREPPPPNRAMRRLRRIVAAVDVAFAIAGFVVGFLQKNGSTVGHWEAGGVGVLVGFAIAVVLGHLVVLSIGVGRSVGSVTKDAKERPGQPGKD